MVLISVGLVFFVMLSTGVFIVASLRANEANEARSYLEARAIFTRENVFDPAVAQNIREGGTGLGREAFEDAIIANFRAIIATHLSADLEVFIISGSDMQILYTSPAEINQGFIGKSSVVSALTGVSSFEAFTASPNTFGDIGYWFEYAHSIFLSELFHAHQAPNQGDLADYVIFIRTSANDFLETLAATTNTIIIGGVMAMAAATILTIAFSVPLTKNLLKLIKNIKNFRVDKVDDFEIINTKDEIGHLSQSFGMMGKNLEESIAIITREKNKQDIIMYNMTDGVLAYDSFGVLLHSNHASKELLGVEEIERISFKQLFTSLNVGEEVNYEMDKMEDAIIGRDGRFLNATFNTYRDEGGVIQGIVVVLQDITKHILLDNMRKDFVANVSHELRTPLTTIKTYTETLLDGAAEDPEIRDNFLKTMEYEADRMATIIRDLLELSRFDAGQMEFTFKLGDIVALVKENISKHQISAQKENKKITFESNADRIFLPLDADRISQTLNNLISNSLRYSQEGAEVAVEIQERDAHCLIYIKDNGIGIPKEDLRSIFERFYRVDKARSRELGGTGLGLSIAKEIIEGHKGRIHATSEVGVGTIMTIRLPK